MFYLKLLIRGIFILFHAHTHTTRYCSYKHINKYIFQNALFAFYTFSHATVHGSVIFSLVCAMQLCVCLCILIRGNKYWNNKALCASFLWKCVWSFSKRSKKMCYRGGYILLEWKKSKNLVRKERILLYIHINQIVMLIRPTLARNEKSSSSLITTKSAIVKKGQFMKSTVWDNKTFQRLGEPLCMLSITSALWRSRPV